MDFGRFVKNFRDQKGFSQTGLSDFLGFHFNTVSRWERGQQIPRDSQLRKVSLRTGVPFAKLWAMANSKNPFIRPVYRLSNLKTPIDRVLTNSSDVNCFWVEIDKSLETDRLSVYGLKLGDSILVEPSAQVSTGNLILHNGKIKKSWIKTEGC